MTSILTRKESHKPKTEEHYDIGEYVVLDSQIWFVIDSRKGELSRDEFIAKILAHALGLSYSEFGGQS